MLDRLPPEILLKVMGDLSENDLTNAQRVNRRLAEVGGDNSLWQTLLNDAVETGAIYPPSRRAVKRAHKENRGVKTLLALHKRCFKQASSPDGVRVRMRALGDNAELPKSYHTSIKNQVDVTSPWEPHLGSTFVHPDFGRMQARILECEDTLRLVATTSDGAINILLAAGGVIRPRSDSRTDFCVPTHLVLINTQPHHIRAVAIIHGAYAQIADIDLCKGLGPAPWRALGHVAQQPDLAIEALYNWGSTGVVAVNGFEFCGYASIEALARKEPSFVQPLHAHTSSEMLAPTANGQVVAYHISKKRMYVYAMQHVGKRATSDPIELAIIKGRHVTAMLPLRESLVACLVGAAILVIDAKSKHVQQRFNLPCRPEALMTLDDDRLAISSKGQAYALEMC